MVRLTEDKKSFTKIINFLPKSCLKDFPMRGKVEGKTVEKGILDKLYH